MALITTRTVRERGTLNSVAQRYYVHNDDLADLSQTTAVTAAITQFNLDFPSFIPNNHSTERRTDHSFHVDVLFNAKTPGPLDFPEAEGQGTFRTRFNFQARSRFLKNSINTVLVRYEPSYIPGGNVNDAFASPFGGLINVTIDGPQGLHLNAPSPTFVHEYTLVNTNITDAYLLRVEELCGKYNEAIFYGRDPGEVLLTSCTGGKVSETTWQLSFGFAFVKNETDLRVNDQITLPFKAGHDFVWTYDLEREHAIAATGKNILAPAPVVACVEQVWPKADLNELYNTQPEHDT